MSLVARVGRRLLNCRTRPAKDLAASLHTTQSTQPATVRMAYDRAYVQSHTPADYRFPSDRAYDMSPSPCVRAQTPSVKVTNVVS